MGAAIAPDDRTASGARPRFWHDNLLLNGAGLVAGLGNLGYHVVVARMLGPVNYGVLQALTTFSVVVQAPVSLLTVLFTRRGADRREIAPIVGVGFGVGVVLWLAIAWATPVIAGAFHLPARALLVYSLALVPAVAYGALVGVMQWAAQFLWVGGLTAWGSLGRMAGAFVASFRRWGLYGLVWMPPVVAATAMAAGVYGARLSVDHAAERGFTHHGGLYNAGVVGVLVLLWTSADVLVVKHALGPTAAGLYGGLSTMGRAPAYFAGAVGAVLLSSIQRDRRRRTAYLVRSLILVAGLGVLGLVAYEFWGPSLIILTLGRRFLGLEPHLLGFTAAMSLQGLFLILLYYGAGRAWRLVSLVGALGLTAWLGMLWTARDLAQVIDRTFWVSAVAMALGLVVVVVREWRDHGPGPQDGPVETREGRRVGRLPHRI